MSNFCAALLTIYTSSFLCFLFFFFFFKATYTHVMNNHHDIWPTRISSKIKQPEFAFSIPPSSRKIKDCELAASSWYIFFNKWKKKLAKHTPHLVTRYMMPERNRESPLLINVWNSKNKKRELIDLGQVDDGEIEIEREREKWLMDRWIDTVWILEIIYIGCEIKEYQRTVRWYVYIYIYLIYA